MYIMSELCVVPFFFYVLFFSSFLFFSFGGCGMEWREVESTEQGSGEGNDRDRSQLRLDCGLLSLRVTVNPSYTGGRFRPPILCDGSRTVWFSEIFAGGSDNRPSARRVQRVKH